MLLITAALSACAALTIPPHLSATPDLWRDIGVPHANRSVEVLLALRQRNTDELERRFWRAADPALVPVSPDVANTDSFGSRYGAYAASTADIAALVAPDPRDVAALRDVLHKEHGVAPDETRLEGHGDFMSFKLPVVRLERLLGGSAGLLHVYEHVLTGASFVRATSPPRLGHIARWVDFIGGVGTHLPSSTLETALHGTGRKHRRREQAKVQHASEEGDRTQLGGRTGASTERRLDELTDGHGVPAVYAHHVPMANPLAWRGSNVSIMVALRCKDGSFAKSVTACPIGSGLRTLRVALTPDDKAVPAAKYHFSADGNEFYPDVKDNKWYRQTDLTPQCKPCAQYSGYHFGVDTYKLCHGMGLSLGMGAKADELLTCLVNWDASNFVGVSLRLQAQLFFEHPSPPPGRFDAMCDPGADAFICDNHFTPQPHATPHWLHAFYHIPAGLHGDGALHGNAMAAVEFLGKSFDPLDVATFLRNDHVPSEAVAHVVGANDGYKHNSGEATQDVEVMMSIAPLVPTWYWSTAGHRPPVNGGNNEPFLRWLLDLAKQSKPPLVQSVSYADDEGSLSRAYTDRINAELMKAALRGISIVFDSGVDGAGGQAARQITGNRTCGRFRPQFPASSPYVTSVGSTALERVGGELHEVVADSYLGVGVTSGGGFSQRYRRPAYQQRAVQRYLSHFPQPPDSLFSAEASDGTPHRGYPDVSAIAPHFAMVQRRRSASALGGTSAAAPTVAGVVALLNDVRLAGGLPPLGFLNPLLYSLSDTFANATQGQPFRDVRYGNNRCSALSKRCCVHGFHAAPGWDAASGLGSIDFGAVSKQLNSYLGACLGMDCGGGTCMRGVCVCNDGFAKNAAGWYIAALVFIAVLCFCAVKSSPVSASSFGSGRCTPLAPFPIKEFEQACAGALAALLLCCCCCCGGSSDDDNKSRGCCERCLRCCGYRVVLKRKGGKVDDSMNMTGGANFAMTETVPLAQPQALPVVPTAGGYQAGFEDTSHQDDMVI